MHNDCGMLASLSSYTTDKSRYSCTGLLRGGTTQRSSNGFFCFDAAVRARKLMGQCRGRTHLPIRSGKTNRSVPALIERLAQAWLNVTSLRSHPDELIRQAHLGHLGQKYPNSRRVNPTGHLGVAMAEGNGMEQLPGMQWQVTEEWLGHISDEQGLTRGQTALLKRWRDANDLIPEQVAHFLEGCRGYRNKTCQDWRGMA